MSYSNHLPVAQHLYSFPLAPIGQTPDPYPPWNPHLPEAQSSGPTHSLTRSPELWPWLSQSLPRCKAPVIPFSLPFSLPPLFPPIPTNTFGPHSEPGGWSTRGPLQQSCCFCSPFIPRQFLRAISYPPLHEMISVNCLVGITYRCRRLSPQHTPWPLIGLLKF